LAATTGGLDTVVPPHSVHRLIEDLQRQGAQPLLIHREQGGHSTNAEDTRDAVNFVLRQALTGRADR
ncbi:MAG: alpha/beta hydrolase, partial [Planctomycetaceae bacterium]